MIHSPLVANRVTSQFKKDIFQIGENGAEIRDPDPIFGQTMNHLGDQIVAMPTNRKRRVVTNNRLDSRNRPKTLGSASFPGGEDDGSLWAVPVHQALGLVHVDDASVFDDCYPVAQPLGLLHEVSSQENRLAALTNAAH